MKKNYFDSISNAPLFLKFSKASHLGVLRFLFFILLFFSSFTATYAQSCNVVKGGDFTGGISSDWTSQNQANGWYHYNNQAYIEKDGIGSPGVSLKQTLTGLLGGVGKPLTLSFKIRGQNAGRKSGCQTSSTIVIKIGGTTYMTIVNPDSNSTITTTNITLANNATYTQTGFPLNVVGNESDLNQGIITLTIPWESRPITADLEFVVTSSLLLQSVGCAAWGGDDWFLDDISVVPSSPTAFTVTGSSVCTGNSTTIGLSSSQLGVSYQLQKGGVNVGTAVPGTGNALSFGSQNTVGSYTVVGFLTGTTTCITSMIGSVAISPNNTVGAASSPPNVCVNNAITAVTHTTTGATGVGTVTGLPAGVSANWSSNVITISGTPTASGTFNYSIPLTGGCGTVNATGTITVRSNNTVGAASSSPNVCVNNAITAVTHATTGATGIGTVTGLPAGVTANWSSNVITISGTPTASGTFNYSIPLTGSCSTVNAIGTITVNSVTTPTASVTAQPNCSELTGTITLSGLPSSGTINQTIGGVTTSIPVSGGGTQSITGLAAGSYTFTVSNASCTSAVSNQVTIIPFSGAIAKWDGTNWSSTPTINDRVEFNASYSSGTNAPANVDACSCYVNNNAKVTFNLGHTLNILNEVVVNEGTGITAALLFEDKASLVQHKDVPFKPNSGSITYKRKTSITRFDYTYWSSPVVGRTLKQLSPNTLFDRYFIYNNGWVVSRSGVAEMFAGLGYIARGPQPYSTTVATDFTGEFIGKPHNGVYNGNDLAVVPNRDYLLGNPYPSAIDADKFLNDVNNAAILQGTIYFWTHNSEPVAAQGTTTYKYAASDYASYNKTGGAGTGGVIAGTGGKIPNGKIAAGQGFFVRAIGTGKVLFNNSMRLAATQTTYLDNSQFFKLDTGKNAVAAVSTTEKNRVWLNLTNTEGAFKQILVGYITGATNEYDNGFVGVTYNGNSFVDFYSVNQDKNLVIQGRALPFVKKDSVALGYNTTIKGDFKISIDQVDGIFTTQNVLLEDKELKVQHDLKKEAYTFTTEKGTFNNRFVLRYVDKNAVDEVIIPEVPGEDSNTAVMVSVKEGEIRINSTLTKLDKVVVYDVTGRKLFQKNKIDANVLLIPHFVWNHQVLVVDVVLIDGTKVSKKIIN